MDWARKRPEHKNAGSIVPLGKPVGFQNVRAIKRPILCFALICLFPTSPSQPSHPDRARIEKNAIAIEFSILQTNNHHQKKEERTMMFWPVDQELLNRSSLQACQGWRGKLNKFNTFANLAYLFTDPRI